MICLGTCAAGMGSAVSGYTSGQSAKATSSHASFLFAAARERATKRCSDRSRCLEHYLNGTGSRARKNRPASPRPVLTILRLVPPVCPCEDLVCVRLLEPPKIVGDGAVIGDELLDHNATGPNVSQFQHPVDPVRRRSFVVPEESIRGARRSSGIRRVEDPDRTFSGKVVPEIRVCIHRNLNLMPRAARFPIMTFNDNRATHVILRDSYANATVSHDAIAHSPCCLFQLVFLRSAAPARYISDGAAFLRLCHACL